MDYETIYQHYFNQKKIVKILDSKLLNNDENIIKIISSFLIEQCWECPEFTLNKTVQLCKYKESIKNVILCNDCIENNTCDGRSCDNITLCQCSMCEYENITCNNENCYKTYCDDYKDSCKDYHTNYCNWCEEYFCKGCMEFYSFSRAGTVCKICVDDCKM